MNDESNDGHREDVGKAKLSDQEIESRVFRTLEARQKDWDNDQDEAIVILQYPDNRTLCQRFVGWWHLRHQGRNRKTEDVGVEIGSEPD
ncbi:MAG: hypothetical protein AAGF50_00690 [Pseudomonadota bacterium]